LLLALDILGVKLLFALGYKADGIYSIKKREGNGKVVKHVFHLDDGTVVKVV